jgi:hypothetical protein
MRCPGYDEPATLGNFLRPGILRELSWLKCRGRNAPACQRPLWSATARYQTDNTSIEAIVAAAIVGGIASGACVQLGLQAKLIISSCSGCSE